MNEKMIDEYLKYPFAMKIVEDTEEGGFIVSFPELRGCITHAESLEEAVKVAEDAKYAWLEAAIEDGYPIPIPAVNESYSGQFKLRLPKSLHRELSEHAKLEGISMNQYCLYLLAKHDAVRGRLQKS